jgi:dTDP-4-dehydrorhamnose reductase
MIIVLGSKGMAGHVIADYLKLKGYPVTTVARDSADIIADFENKADVDFVIKRIKELNGTFVINCVGLLVRDSINRPDRAIILNAWLPHYLANNLINTRTRIVHISTDCVFDGGKGSYVESDSHTETNHYGRTKSLGELDNGKDITFRTSIIGHEIKKNGSGLLNWFVNRSDDQVNGWENVIWNGITTLQLAKYILIFIDEPNVTGVYHLVTDDHISKWELLTKINEIYGLGKKIIKTRAPRSVDKTLVDSRKTFQCGSVKYERQLRELYSYSNKSI